MEEKQSTFEEFCLPHLDAAYNLARLLVDRDQDAQEIVQEAYLRALKIFKRFHGENARAWILLIVRNTALSWLKKQPGHMKMLPSDKVIDGAPPEEERYNKACEYLARGKLAWHKAGRIHFERTARKNARRIFDQNREEIASWYGNLVPCLSELKI